MTLVHRAVEPKEWPPLSRGGVMERLIFQWVQRSPRSNQSWEAQSVADLGESYSQVAKNRFLARNRFVSKREKM